MMLYKLIRKNKPLSFMPTFQNPFKPGAGHMPPYLAGRGSETKDFLRLLEQRTILSNVVLTGLRGVGKTVLLEKWKPLAIERKWLWVGTDLSESTSVSEEMLVVRLLTDLSVVTFGVTLSHPVPSIGFGNEGQGMSRAQLRSVGSFVSNHAGTPGRQIESDFGICLALSERARGQGRHFCIRRGSNHVRPC